jgi:sugar/nucleoside kinase (ribokinase family)
MTSEDYQYAFLGGMRQDYCITHDGRVFLGVLGGNAVYAAVGAKHWSNSVGIISRVGSNYPIEWLDDLRHVGINVDSVLILPDPQNTLTFYAYLTTEERVDTNPPAHFLRIHHELPKELVEYRSSTEGQDARVELGPLAVRPADLPAHFGVIKAIHLAPADYLTHSSLPFQLREQGIRLISLDPSERYMDPGFQEELPALVHGLDAFLPSEAEASAFFRPMKMEIMEMAEAFGAMGCRLVVIKCGARGQFLWDSDSRRHWHIPAYPAEVRDVTGAGDAFCGGFLIGLHLTDSPLEAALRGSVSASLTVEGSGALYALQALPGLVQARLEALRPTLKEI